MYVSSDAQKMYRQAFPHSFTWRKKKIKMQIVIEIGGINSGLKKNMSVLQKATQAGFCILTLNLLLL